MTVLTISQDTLIQLPDGANGGAVTVTYHGTTTGSVIASGDDQGRAVITTGRLAKLTALDGKSALQVVGREAGGRVPARVTVRIYPEYPAGKSGPIAPITLTGLPVGAPDAPGIWDLSNIDDASGGLDVVTAAERQGLVLLRERAAAAATAAEVGAGRALASVTQVAQTTDELRSVAAIRSLGRAPRAGDPAGTYRFVDGNGVLVDAAWSGTAETGRTAATATAAGLSRLRGQLQVETLAALATLDMSDPAVQTYLLTELGRGGQYRRVAAGTAGDPDGVRVFPTSDPNVHLVNVLARRSVVYAEEAGVRPGNSAANNAAALQKAMNAYAPNKNSSVFVKPDAAWRTGATVILPGGEIEMGTAYARSMVHVKGAGMNATIVIPKPAADYGFTFDQQGQTTAVRPIHVHYSDFSIAPNGDLNTPDYIKASGINLDYNMYQTLQNVNIYHLLGFGIRGIELFDAVWINLPILACGTLVKQGSSDLMDLKASYPAIALLSGTNDLANAIHAFGLRLEHNKGGLVLAGYEGKQVRENQFVACKHEESDIWLAGTASTRFVANQLTNSRAYALASDAQTDQRELVFSACAWRGARAGLTNVPGSRTYDVMIDGGDVDGVTTPFVGENIHTRNMVGVGVVTPFQNGSANTASGNRLRGVTGDTAGGTKAFGAAVYQGSAFRADHNFTEGNGTVFAAFQVGADSVVMDNWGNVPNLDVDVIGDNCRIERNDHKSGAAISYNGREATTTYRDKYGDGGRPPQALDEIGNPQFRTDYQNTSNRTLTVYQAVRFDVSNAGAKAQILMGPAANPTRALAPAYRASTTAIETVTLVARIPRGWYYRLDGFGSAALEVQQRILE